MALVRVVGVDEHEEMMPPALTAPADGFVPMTDLEYDYEEIVALGIEADDETGEWLVPYGVMFPLGSSLDGDLTAQASAGRSPCCTAH
jgi:hypothetical protein